MEDKKRTISVDKEVKILKLKVKAKTMIYDGSILFIYEDRNDENKQKKWKSSEVGIVKRIYIKEGDIIQPGSVILELEKECNHPTVIKDLCAECGADLQKENTKDGNSVTQASVSMIHMVPELKVNEELAQILGKADMDRLLEHKKLVLLVDLDQTLIHTTNDTIPNNIRDVYHFQLYGSRSPWYHTRLRPGTHNFLRGVSDKYELHICTFGSRRYAHMIAGFLDPDGKYFSHRILSRDECFDPNSKTANLKALFPCGENMVCIIDDREDVWEYASNLIHVKPYHFFQHTGDIHAPPGLTKCENDSNKDGFDFSSLRNGISEEKRDENEEHPESAYQGVENDEVACNSELAPVGEINSETSATSKFLDDNSIQNEVNNGEIENVIAEENKNGNVDDGRDPSTEVKIDQSEAAETMQLVDKTPNDSGTTDAAESPQSPDESSNPDGDDTPTPQPKPISSSKIDADGFIVIEETDDYLLYLEEILKIIHAEFFKLYEETSIIPDLKKVVPDTRAKVLRGVNLVFSGIVPNHMRLENSQAYRIARLLGANVTQNIEADTTHLVALRAGTAKVHAAHRRKNLKLVTPEWLWTCAERWEKVDERLFSLKNARLTAEARLPPAHCRSPEHPEPSPFTYQGGGNFPSSQAASFMYTINPLMSLSSEDIEMMEGEVEDIFKESDGELDDTFDTNDNQDADESNTVAISCRKRKLSSDSSSLDDDLKVDERKRRRKKKFKSVDDTSVSSNEDEDEQDDEDNTQSSDSDDDETLNTKFRRGEALPSDLDFDYNTEEGTEEDQESDGEWNVMGAALEREFLEGE